MNAQEAHDQRRRMRELLQQARDEIRETADANHPWHIREQYHSQWRLWWRDTAICREIDNFLAKEPPS